MEFIYLEIALTRLIELRMISLTISGNVENDCLVINDVSSQWPSG